MELELNKEELHREENQLREQVASLSVNQKRQYYAQELQQIKDPDTYTALSWIFFSGLHHFYLGKWQRGLINLAFVCAGLFFYLSGIYTVFGTALITLIFIIELPQIFKDKNIIHRYNNKLMKELLQQFEHKC